MIQDWIRAERTELARLLAGLSPAQWDQQSLCDGWSVRHVVAHVTMPFRYSTARFLLGLALAGGSFQRMSDGVARRDAAAMTPEQLVAALADNAGHPWKPPGGGYEAALTHDVIHGLDITQPLGLELAIPAEPMTAVLATVSGAQSRKHFGVRADGVQLRASDLDWSDGSGPPVIGRAKDLALLLTGRRVPAGALTGDGADLLASQDGARAGGVRP